MTARDCVLEAKSMLSAMPAASLLSRESFITICVEASLAFLRERHNRHLKSNYNNSNNNNKNKNNNNNINNKRNSVGGTHSNSCGRSDAFKRRKNSPEVLTSSLSSPLYNQQETEEKWQKQNSQTLSFNEDELKRLRELLEVEYHRVEFNNNNNNNNNNMEKSSYSAVPPAKLEAAGIIKRILNDPYKRGEISRQQYTVIVLAVLEKLFPDLIAVKNAVIPSQTNPNVYRNRSNSNNNNNNNSENNIMSNDINIVEGSSGNAGNRSLSKSMNSCEDEEKKIIRVNLPQELNDRLRPDVAALAIELTEQSLQHYLSTNKKNNNNKNENNENNLLLNRGCSSNEEGDRILQLVNGISPLPRDPHNTTPSRIIQNDSESSSSPFSINFDDIFEQQIEKLRQLLEEKYALDLSGAYTSTNPQRKSTHNPSSSYSYSHNNNNNNNNTAADIAIKQKREELIAEALYCKERMQETQERLGSIMQELREAEQSIDIVH